MIIIGELRNLRLPSRNTAPQEVELYIFRRISRSEAERSLASTYSRRRLDFWQIQHQQSSIGLKG